jgi:transcription elongation factor Elf1
MSRGKGHATIQCASCGLKQEVETSPADQMVDVYCRFTDKFYGASQPSAPKQMPTQAEETVETPVASESREVEEKSEPVDQVPPVEEPAPFPEEQVEASETSEQTSEEFDASEESQADEEAPRPSQSGL